MSNPDRGRRLVVVLTLITTIVAAVVAGLSVDAGTRQDAANRESEYLVLIATNQTVSDIGAENYQTSLVSDVVSNSADGLAHDMAALQLAATGDASGALTVTALANGSRARADAARKLSDLYQSPKWGPTSADGFPDVKGYFAAQADAEQAIVTRQNQASDTYNAWSAKGDTYVAILSVLAVTFFLLGLAQVSKRMRTFLATCAGGLLLVSIVWTAGVLTA